MATRQYIGARYVPKFYVNSVDGSAAWQSNVVYDPLMYVTLTNGHMYISKKQVPATVGTPAENPQYWLDVGSYNGFIDNLQQQINALVIDVNAKANMVGIAPVENGDNTVGSYTAGDEFYRNGVLYKAKTTIAANTAFSSLVLNTDYEAAPTVSSEIKALANKINFINPSTFTGTDGDKIQAAVTQCGHDGGIIVICDDYILDKNIDLTTYTGSHSIKFIGLGGSITFGNYKFYSSLADNRNFSGADFTNVIFKDIALVGFDGDTLIRCSFLGCTFENTTGKILKATNYLQQFIFDNCHILGDMSTANNTGIVVECSDILSMQITNCRIECLKSVIVCSTASHNLVIIGNTIESFADSCIILSGVLHACMIHGNYFETIADTYVAIDISGMTAGAISIVSNYFKSANGYSFLFSKLPSGNSKSIFFASNSFPVANTKKYEITGANGVLRRLNEFASEGGDASGNTQYLPLYRFLDNGCLTANQMTYVFNISFGSGGRWGTALCLMGQVGNATITSATLEDGTALSASDFALENQDQFYANVQCTNSATRPTIANKIVRLGVQIN